MVGMCAVVKVTRQNQEVATVYLRNIPEELHKRLRVAAAIKGESLRTLALRALEAEVERMEAEEAKVKREGQS
jgi:plasmid stability protein